MNTMDNQIKQLDYENNKLTKICHEVEKRMKTMEDDENEYRRRCREEKEAQMLRDNEKWAELQKTLNQFQENMSSA